MTYPMHSGPGDKSEIISNHFDLPSATTSELDPSQGKFALPISYARNTPYLLNYAFSGNLL